MKKIILVILLLLNGCGLNNDPSYVERNVKNIAYANIFIERTGEAWTLKEIYHFQTEYYYMNEEYVYKISDKGGGFFDGKERYIIIFFKANGKATIKTKGCNIKYRKNGIKIQDLPLYGEKIHFTYTKNFKKINIYWIDSICDIRFLD